MIGVVIRVILFLSLILVPVSVPHNAHQFTGRPNHPLNRSVASQPLDVPMVNRGENSLDVPKS